MMASGVWAGASDIEKVHKVRALDDPEASVKSELMRIGYLGGVKASWEAMPMAAHFELHIGKGCSSTVVYRTTDSDILQSKALSSKQPEGRLASSKACRQADGSRSPSTAAIAILGPRTLQTDPMLYLHPQR
jgi:hypothetical protein